MSKSKNLQEFFKDVLPEETAIRASGRCVGCAKEMDDNEQFKDELSRSEYRISGLCQKCQDDVFRVEE